MAGQRYDTVAGQHEKFKGRVLEKARVDEMLTKLGAMEEIPQNKSELIEWTRFLPYGGVDNQWIAAGGDVTFVAQHTIQEGVTPTPDSLSWTTVQATLQEIGCLYSYTNKTRYVHEKGAEIPPEMEDQLATRMVLTREMMTYGEFKTTSNLFFGGGGSTVGTTNGVVTSTKFQDISRDIMGHHGFTVNKMLGGSQNVGTTPIQPSWPVYCHSDMEKTFENMVGFVKRANYGGQYTPIDEDYEIGAIGRFRIIINPILTFMADSGAAVGTFTGGSVGSAGKSTNGTLLDIYPLIIPGRGKGGGESFGQVALRGFNSLMVNHLPPDMKSKSDPLQQRGYVAGATWQAQSILNDDWLAVAYSACEA